MEFLRVIDDRSRLKILRLLLEKEICVCELAGILEISQPTVSQHLAKLRALNLVSERREGQWVIYSLNRDILEGYLDDLRLFFVTPLNQLPELQEEAARLLTVKRTSDVNP